jgi:hypothetical protein
VGGPSEVLTDGGDPEVERVAVVDGVVDTGFDGREGDLDLEASAEKIR